MFEKFTDAEKREHIKGILNFFPGAGATMRDIHDMTYMFPSFETTREFVSQMEENGEIVFDEMFEGYRNP